MIWSLLSCGGPQAWFVPDVDLDWTLQDSDPACGVEFQAFPDETVTDHGILDPIRVELSDADDEAFFEVLGASGELIRAEDHKSLSYRPDEPLEPERTYRVDLSTCAESTSWTFSTSSDGLARQADLLGRTWLIDVQGSGRIPTPSGLGEVLQSYLFPVLIEVRGHQDERLELSLAAADPETGLQDPCWATSSLEVDFGSDPILEGEGESAEVLGLAFEDLRLGGVFSQDGSRVSGFWLEGVLDSRGLVHLFGEEAGEDEFCNLVAGFGVSCEPCSDELPFCVPLRLEGMHAEEVFTAIEPVEEPAADCQ